MRRLLLAALYGWPFKVFAIAVFVLVMWGVKEFLGWGVDSFGFWFFAAWIAAAFGLAFWLERRDRQSVSAD